MAWIKAVGERFYLYYRAEGREHSKPLGKISRKKANRELALFEAQQANPGPPGITLNLIVNRYLLWHRDHYPTSHNRISQIVQQHLLPNFGAERLATLDPDMVEDWMKQRLQSVKPSTVEKELRTLKALVNKAVEWGYLQGNPIRYVKAPQQRADAPPPFYTTDQLLQLYEASTGAHSAIWRLAANTGMRRGELLQLRKEDCREQGIYVISREGGRTKSGKWRLIPWSNGARNAVAALETPGEYLIPRIAPASMSRAFVTDAGRAGLTGSLHWLRHTYASHLVMQGLPLRAVQQILGHSTISVTERYAHLADDYVRDAVDTFSI